FVLLKASVGVDGTITTIILVNEYGVHIEYNPIVRWLLTTPLWPVWFALNAIVFAVFIMAAGSYYISTRTSGNYPADLVALVIAIRTALTTGNLLFALGSGMAPAVSLGMGLVIFKLVRDSFGGRTMPTPRTIILGLKMKYMRLNHYLIVRQLRRKIPRTRQKQLSETVRLTRSLSLSSLVRRMVYATLAAAVFLAAPLFAWVIGQLPVLSSQSWRHEGPFFWTHEASAIFLSGFALVSLIVAISVYLVLKAVEVEEAF
ncbi:MAG: hypothetical protein QXQ81_08160, partial [Candidatus Thorarchaeota archaeon]